MIKLKDTVNQLEDYFGTSRKEILELLHDKMVESIIDSLYLSRNLDLIKDNHGLNDEELDYLKKED